VDIKECGSEGKFSDPEHEARTAALDAVKQWKYRPYLQQGKPVEVETEITVNFTLLN